MVMMNKLNTVLWREYIVNIKRPGFWLMTLGLPLLFLLMIVLISFVLFFMISGQIDKKTEELGPPVLGIIDNAGLVDASFFELDDEEKQHMSLPSMRRILKEISNGQDPLESAHSFLKTASELVKPETYQYVLFTSPDEAEMAILNKKVRSAFVIPEGFLITRNIEVIVQKESFQSDRRLEDFERKISRTLLLKKLSPTMVKEIFEPFHNVEYRYIESENKETKLGRELKDELKKTFIPLLFVSLLMVSLFSSTQRLLLGLMEEKQNRIIEILLSSITTNQLLAGKIVGLSLVGLTQVIIWMGLILVPLMIILSFLNIGLVHLLIFVLFFLAGYFLLATLIVTTGSLGNTTQEGNQWAGIWTLLALFPLYFFVILSQDPSGTAATVLTYVPITAAFTVILRMTYDAISSAEIVLSFLVLILSTVLCLRLGSRIFRFGILMTGKSYRPFEILKVLREAFRDR